MFQMGAQRMTALRQRTRGGRPDAISSGAMRLPLFQVDAFASRRFTGNPAAVVVMPAFADEVTLRVIAAENKLAGTAFRVIDDGCYRLRSSSRCVVYLRGAIEP